jgi:hypothetical protein
MPTTKEIQDFPRYDLLEYISKNDLTSVISEIRFLEKIFQENVDEEDWMIREYNLLIGDAIKLASKKKNIINYILKKVDTDTVNDVLEYIQESDTALLKEIMKYI